MFGKIGIEIYVLGDEFEVVVLIWCSDLERFIDLVEEVGCLVGFDKIEDCLSCGMMGGEYECGEVLRYEVMIVTCARCVAFVGARCLLFDQGLHEVVNYSFFGEDEFDVLEVFVGYVWRKVRRVVNLLTVEHGLMCTLLISGFIRNFKMNFL